MTPRVAIIGGGLAGLAAAVRLGEAEVPVTLIESRRRLGGRASSFVDPRTGETLDNCQHVLMGCCTHLIDFYDRLGVLDAIAWHRQMYWTDVPERGTTGRGSGSRLKPTAESGQPRALSALGTRYSNLRAGWLPAPLHLAGAFRRMRLYSREEQRAIARAMWRMIRMGAGGRLAWTDRPFIDFLMECQQPASVVERFWNVIIVSACNLPVDRVCASHAIQVFQEGFLANRWSHTMGLSTIPLSDLYEPALPYIESRCGEVRRGVSARGILFSGERVTGVVTDAGLIEAGAVVAAVPFDRLEKLTSDAMKAADARLRNLSGFQSCPILGVHLRFAQQVMDLPHLVLIPRYPGEHGSEIAEPIARTTRNLWREQAGSVQWLFNKGVDETGAQHVHAVISAADAWMGLDEQAIIERVLADVRAVLPAAVGQEPLSARSVKEKRATFAAVPGIDAIRPRAAPGAIGIGGGGIANLFLAGDWCDTGWPATMEGAVRSGYAAAEAITGERRPVEEVPPGRLASLLGLRGA